MSFSLADVSINKSPVSLGHLCQKDSYKVGTKCNFSKLFSNKNSILGTQWVCQLQAALKPQGLDDLQLERKQ